MGYTGLVRRGWRVMAPPSCQDGTVPERPTIILPTRPKVYATHTRSIRGAYDYVEKMSKPDISTTLNMHDTRRASRIGYIHLRAPHQVLRKEVGVAQKPPRRGAQRRRKRQCRPAKQSHKQRTVMQAGTDNAKWFVERVVVPITTTLISVIGLIGSKLIGH